MFHVLFAAFLSTQASDATTTVVALRQPAIYRESNPFLPKTPTKIVLVKSSFVVCAAAMTWHARKQHPKAVAFALVVASSAAAWSTYRNIRVMQQQK